MRDGGIKTSQKSPTTSNAGCNYCADYYLFIYYLKKEDEGEKKKNKIWIAHAFVYYFSGDKLASVPSLAARRCLDGSPLTPILITHQPDSLALIIPSALYYIIIFRIQRITYLFTLNPR